MMRLKRTIFHDVEVFTNALHIDERGLFLEAFNAVEFEREHGARVHFVQDNLSVSKAGVIRGLHYQIRNPQSKFVICLSGSLLDVVVDLRVTSPSFGQWFSIELSSSTMDSIYIPIGFAHGFCALEDNTMLAYKVSDFWNKDSEYCIRWDDEHLNIEWPSCEKLLVSEKDKLGLSFEKAPVFYE